MAGKTPTELADLIADLRTELHVLRAQFDALNTDLDRPEYARMRERITKIESLLAVIDAAALVRQIATLQEQVAELKKWREESERKKWQFWFGVGICTLTFSANVAMNLVLFFARKPG